MPIVDKTGLTIGILAGAPQDVEWPLLHLQACEAIANLRPKCAPRKGKCRVHRRGAFVALRCGISHGGGQVCPKNLDNSPSDAAVLNEMNSHPFFKRVAGFATGKHFTVIQPYLTLTYTCRSDGYLGAQALRLLCRDDWTSLPMRPLPGASVSK